MGGIESLPSLAADMLELNFSSDDKSFLYKDIQQRNIFAKEFFGTKSDIFPKFLLILGYYDINLWALVITFSTGFRDKIYKSYLRSCIKDSYRLKQIHRYLIIEPVCRMHWLKKVHEVINRFNVLTQKGGTCWAYSIAAAINITQHRILGHEIDDPKSIVDFLINFYIKKTGKTKKDVMNDGNYVNLVLNDILHYYNLHYRLVDENDLKEVIMNGRVCVSSFVLNKYQWFLFFKFFEKNPTKAITLADINRKFTKQEQIEFYLAQINDPPSYSDGGHAVLLIENNRNEYVFYNSYGKYFADNGKFRVRKGNFVELTFYDIYWNENELTKYERNLWERRSNEAIGKFYSLVNRYLSSLFNESYNIFNRLKFKDELSLTSFINDADLLFFWSCIKSFKDSEENASRFWKYILCDTAIRFGVVLFNIYSDIVEELNEIYNSFWRTD